RAAEAAGITPQAMKVEVDKAYRRRQSREKRARERAAMSPVQREQPQARSIRYTNVRSAMAEEGLLRLVLRDSSLLDKTDDLRAEQFSSPLLGRAFELLRARYRAGLQPSLAALGEDFTGEELAHLTQVSQKKDELVSEDAFRDYRNIIREESARAGIQSEQDLLALRDRLKQTKGYGG
ncbi:MAG: DNA primase, partial [Oscillospiraceae bacterium]|nr:DNA primase [Oscillospiraceae bacterium]